MYRVVREELSRDVAVAAFQRSESTRRSPITANRRAPDTAASHEAARPTLRRRIARTGLRVIRPIARPIAWRVRTFLSEPLYRETAALTAQIAHERASSFASAQRSDAAIGMLGDSVRELTAEVRALRNEVARLRGAEGKND